MNTSTVMTSQTPFQAGVLVVRGARAARGVVSWFLPGTACPAVPHVGTGLPAALRLRPLGVPMTGLPIGVETAGEAAAYDATSNATTNTTPGDLPPGGPPSD
ncbi:hypothetical protein [Modestobacter sp. Leaf380]|uniref:hypothetical protein n=1 Tax=Modestobacter sp. Leaf380 TaxID=1736356 RepID=UPI000701F45D|nr:hypothetical protein [Modestobacter sp. Leaf380]KQS73355.1 hypothetical protein ASG41_01400 [Modestobacter sp. Leaf380]